MSKRVVREEAGARVVAFVRDGGRGWSAELSCSPKPKGNHKVLVPIGKRCRVCKRPERYVPASSKKDLAAEKAVTTLLRSVAPPAPFTRDVLLRLQVRLPIPKSWSKAKREAARAGLHRPTSGKGSSGPIPDLGNLEKCLEDALEKGGWVTNDSLIAKRYSEKIYHDEPGYVVSVQELPSWPG